MNLSASFFLASQSVFSWRQKLPLGLSHSNGDGGAGGGGEAGCGVLAFLREVETLAPDIAIGGVDGAARTIHARLKVGNTYVNRNMIGAVVGVQPFGGEGLSGTSNVWMNAIENDPTEHIFIEALIEKVP